MLKNSLFAVLLFLLAGCTLFDTVPAGTPPAGAITENSVRREFDVRSAVNYMTTSLSIHLLTDPLEENFIALDSDSATAAYAAMVLHEITRITATAEKPLPCANVLRTRDRDAGWDFQLVRNGRTVWQEYLDLSLCSPQKGSQQK